MRITGSGYPGIDLREARVLITGGGRGIGRATAAAFAAKGAQVVLADVDKPAADAAAAAIGASAFELDVRSRDQWDAVVTAVGGVDVLINNAGVMPAGAFLEEPDAVGRATLDIGLSAATRLEFAAHGVSVSCVLPSAVRTRLSSGLRLGHGMPTVDPEDVAAAILRTCATRKAEVAVPSYLGPVDIALAAAPERAVRLVRGLFDGDRALHPADEQTRAAYEREVRSID
ncbi:SDR family NAD(P)-dependent oxidoreductase [Nocardia gipuzkoensis]